MSLRKLSSLTILHISAPFEDLLNKMRETNALEEKNNQFFVITTFSLASNSL